MCRVSTQITGNPATFGKTILAEFIYGGKVTPTLPLNPAKEHWVGWWIKVTGLPLMYWNYMLKGYVWFPIAQSSVAKYMVKRCGPPSPGWRTFLRSHAPDIAAIDLFVAPTIGFDLLYVLVIVRLERRKLVWMNVTPHPTAEWIARHITEAFPWAEAPRYLIRDRVGSTALPSPTDYGPWESATSRLPQARHGRTASPKG